MLTDVDDMVVDPFGGSCVTGEVAERLRRKWVCCELVEDYLRGAIGRFETKSSNGSNQSNAIFYKLPKPGSMWSSDFDEEKLSEDGMKTRLKKRDTNDAL